MATQLKAEVEAPLDGALATEALNGEDAPRDYEAEARAHGWRPIEEFKGDPSKHVDAETYVTRVDEIMPLLKKKTEAQDRRIKDLERTVREGAAFAGKAEERAYTRAVADLKARQRAAVEIGDVEAHDAISKEIDELRADMPGDKPEAALAIRAREAEIDWRDRNPWYDKGGRATDFANLLVEKYRPRAKDMDPEDFFEMIGRETVDRYPDLAKDETSTPRREARNAVEGVSTARVQRAAKVFVNLPKEAQATCDRLIKNGYPVTRESYVKDYDWNQ